jgi:hypothetical protein
VACKGAAFRFVADEAGDHLGNNRPAGEDEALGEPGSSRGVVEGYGLVVRERRWHPQEIERAVGVEVVEEPSEAAILGVDAFVGVDGVPVEESGAGVALPVRSSRSVGGRRSLSSASLRAYLSW